MKKYLGLIVIVVSLCALSCSTGEKGQLVADTEASGGVVWAQLTMDEAKVKAADENKLILVDVFSPT
jgi:hypothetical protein